MRIVYMVSGWLSLFVGIVATACISRIQWMQYAVGLAILGMLLAIINIFLNAKYYSEEERIPKGYFGLFMSSLPVVFLLLIIFKFKPN